MKNFLSILLLIALTCVVNAQQTAEDSVVYNSDELLITGETEVVSIPDSVWRPNPKKATMLSAAIPGAGQIYNRQWWKVPILYAGIGTIGYFIYWNNDAYVSYRNAYVDFVDDDPTTNRYEDVIPEGYVITDDDWFEDAVENRKDSYRRDRDLCIICMVGLYALNILEAHVAANLYDFDVSDNLSMKIVPDIEYDFMSNQPMLGLCIRFNINK